MQIARNSYDSCGDVFKKCTTRQLVAGKRTPSCRERPQYRMRTAFALTLLAALGAASASALSSLPAFVPAGAPASRCVSVPAVARRERVAPVSAVVLQVQHRVRAAVAARSVARARPLCMQWTCMILQECETERQGQGATQSSCSSMRGVARSRLRAHQVLCLYLQVHGWRYGMKARDVKS